jgi:thymidine kinase
MNGSGAGYFVAITGPMFAGKSDKLGWYLNHEVVLLNLDSDL